MMILSSYIMTLFRLKLEEATEKHGVCFFKVYKTRIQQLIHRQWIQNPPWIIIVLAACRLLQTRELRIA